LPAGSQNAGRRSGTLASGSTASRDDAAQERVMTNKVLWATLLAAAPLLAQAAEPVTVNSVGYDVASNAFVIHGSRFVGAAQRAPEVRVGPVAARVVYYVDDFVAVEAPAGLPAGRHAVVVKPAGETHSGQAPLELTVPIPYVLERPALFARR
jgi:hypothetical protein